jgi:hypothetical protein
MSCIPGKVCKRKVLPSYETKRMQKLPRPSAMKGELNHIFKALMHSFAKVAVTCWESLFDFFFRHVFV